MWIHKGRRQRGHWYLMFLSTTSRMLDLPQPPTLEVAVCAVRAKGALDKLHGKRAMSRPLLNRGR